MPNNAAAIWSAVAASFAALSSFLIMLVQRRNLLESVRPELVLIGWSRSAEGHGDAAHEVITFQTIKNVGRGAALHIHINAFHEAGNRPTAVLSTTRVPILATKDEIDVNGQIRVWWKNVGADAQGFKCLPITIRIFCWDSRNRRHETRYSLLAIELSDGVCTDEIAPGVMLATRTTIERPVWLLKVFSKLGRIPGLGRLFRKA